MFDPLPIPIIGEAGRKLAEDPHPFLDLPQQQTTTVAGDRSTVELRPDLASFLKDEIRGQTGYTL
jgi:hypothetical protein